MFLGAQQTKVSVIMAQALQALGADAVEYITVEGNGRNALDFHIAYYIGRLAAEWQTLGGRSIFPTPTLVRRRPVEAGGVTQLSRYD